ncbi:MAG: DUF2961 domain-containing protein [Spirochaetes bacterium]|nr:MAG: DUF2961 domain-containing protein [Spirochaetota bacterium]
MLAGTLAILWAIAPDETGGALAQGAPVFGREGGLGSLPYARDFVRKRFSSYDRSGGNSDSWRFAPGGTRTIAETQAPGCIRHIWCTIGPAGRDGRPEEHYLRKILVRMYWDGAASPAVEAPIGDFFGMGHGISHNFTSAPLQMSPENGTGFNCWFPMPFARGAKIEVTNECDEGIKLYFYVDWDEHTRADGEALRFHASWNRAVTKGISGEGMGPMEFQDAGTNTSGDDNYVILDARGEGNYVGCNVNIHNQKLSWYWDWPGEGDDMIFVDGETWPPAIHGTGTEDYFSGAFCPTQEYNAPFHGIILPGGVNWASKITYYRYHVLDPVPFGKSIRVTIEHGHANRRSDDWSSTAYWYQRGTGTIRRVPAVAERLPLEDRWTFFRIVANVLLWPIYTIFYAM